MIPRLRDQAVSTTCDMLYAICYLLPATCHLIPVTCQRPERIDSIECNAQF